MLSTAGDSAYDDDLDEEVSSEGDDAESSKILDWVFSLHYAVGDY